MYAIASVQNIKRTECIRIVYCRTGYNTAYGFTSGTCEASCSSISMLTRRSI